MKSKPQPKELTVQTLCGMENILIVTGYSQDALQLIKGLDEYGQLCPSPSETKNTWHLYINPAYNSKEVFEYVQSYNDEDNTE